MMTDIDIWTKATRNIETFSQQMSDGTYGFFLHGFYIFGAALILCELSPSLNGFHIFSTGNEVCE